MKNKKLWVDISIIGLFSVAILGMILRSKILFDLPFIDYNHLLDAHGHFAFTGWVTLALMILMVNELLPSSLNKKNSYQWLLVGIVISSWGMLFSYPFANLISLSNFFSTFFILVTYVFSWVFIKDILKSQVNKTVRLLIISSLVCLILSSIGPFTLAYLFSVKSLNAVLYRNALYTYLHLQYNGFFTLAVFALLVHKLEPKITTRSKRDIHWFANLLTFSIIPSLFISYLWQEPNIYIRLIAIIGSISLLLTFIWLLISGIEIRKTIIKVTPIIRVTGLLSISAFMLKIFLQSFTIFPVVGDAVFGDRPVIIGFLHLVFLAFVSLFILGYYAQTNFLNIKNKFTKVSLIVFIIAVVLNETVLMVQGLGGMFTEGSYLFSWLLWIISVLLFIAALLIAIARFKTKKGYSL